MRYSDMKTLALLVIGLAAFLSSAQVSMAADAENEDTVVFAPNDEKLLTVSDMRSDRGAFGINTVTSEQTLASTAAGNSLNVAGDLTNGKISIGENFGGFGSYVMNTGNNTAINSAVTVNIQMMPSP